MLFSRSCARPAASHPVIVGGCSAAPPQWGAQSGHLFAPLHHLACMPAPAHSPALCPPPLPRQLFWNNKELTAAYDSKTLLDLNLHTGFSLTVSTWVDQGRTLGPYAFRSRMCRSAGVLMDCRLRHTGCNIPVSHPRHPPPRVFLPVSAGLRPVCGARLLAAGG